MNIKRIEYLKKYNREYAVKNRDKILSIKKKYNNKPELRDKFKGYKLKSKFGITVEDYRKMEKDQSCLCKICNKPETARHVHKDRVITKELAVDHCHSTGKVRGLLCANCNRALGYAGENIEVLEKMITYLKEGKND